MPQTTNRRLVRDMNNAPVGRGTVYNTLLKISAATRERARKVNEGEQLRLGKVTRVMERNQRWADHAQTRVLERTQQQLKELQAFQAVLRDQYSVHNFRTLQTPPPRMSDRRRKLETMFYHSGFSQKAMQPEIRRQMNKMDPERIRRKFKRHLLENSRQEVVRLVCRNSQIYSSGGLTVAGVNATRSDHHDTDVINTIATANANANNLPTPEASLADRESVQGEGTPRHSVRLVAAGNGT